MTIRKNGLLPTSLGALALTLAGVPAHGESADLDWIASVYLWGASITVDAGDRSLDASFSDIIDKLEMGFMGRVETQGDTLGGFVDLVYLSVGDEGTIGPASARGNLDMSLMDVAAVWSPGSERFTGTEVYGGFRYLGVDFDLRATLAPPPAEPLRTGIDTSYTDFLLGARYVAPLNDQWRLVVSADFSAGDTEGTWSLAGYGVYRNGPHRFFAGYRHLEAEVEASNGRSVDQTITGPAVGYGFAF